MPINCAVAVFADEDVLDHGQRSGDPQSTVLYTGPALLAAPTRDFERAAAMDGLIVGSLSVHTRDDLSSARRVVVTENVQAGTYYVSENGVSGSGRAWRLTLQRRKVQHA